jgi:competence protein ComEA
LRRLNFTQRRTIARKRVSGFRWKSSAKYHYRSAFQGFTHGTVTAEIKANHPLSSNWHRKDWSEEHVASQGEHFVKHLKQKSALTAGLLSMSFMLTPIGLSQQSQAAPQEPKKSVTELPPGPGRDKLISTCSACHSPNMVLANGQSREGWEELITKMIGMGASGSDEDFTEIVNYLAANLPAHAAAKTAATPDAGSSPAQSSATASDAAGRGNAIFAEKCGACHNADSSEKKVGPGLKGFYARGTYTSDGSKVTDESLLKLIQAGKGMMPPFKDALTPAKIDDLIAYLKTL